MVRANHTMLIEDNSLQSKTQPSVKPSIQSAMEAVLERLKPWIACLCCPKWSEQRIRPSSLRCNRGPYGDPRPRLECGQSRVALRDGFERCKLAAKLIRGVSRRSGEVREEGRSVVLADEAISRCCARSH